MTAAHEVSAVSQPIGNVKKKATMNLIIDLTWIF